MNFPNTRSTASLTAVIALAITVRAGDVTRCDKIFDEVRLAVMAEPAKVLVIVEDAMVANEPCACEIVKGAIVGSKADADLARQIALTAIHISPRMAAVVQDCASALVPVSVPVPDVPISGAADGKGAAVPGGVQPLPDTAGPGLGVNVGTAVMPDDLRGIYLIQPATTGFTKDASKDVDPDGGPKKKISKRPHYHRSIPQSPSVALGP